MSSGTTVFHLTSLGSWFSEVQTCFMSELDGIETNFKVMLGSLTADVSLTAACLTARLKVGPVLMPSPRLEACNLQYWQAGWGTGSMHLNRTAAQNLLLVVLVRNGWKNTFIAKNS
uniref:PPUP8795 n=1 Tax=Poeciliopsis prolifica TaxID=188132 RepID=A0A0S7ERT5_9TELE